MNTSIKNIIPKDATKATNGKHNPVTGKKNKFMDTVTQLLPKFIIMSTQQGRTITISRETLIPIGFVLTLLALVTPAFVMFMTLQNTVEANGKRLDRLEEVIKQLPTDYVPAPVLKVQFENIIQSLDEIKKKLNDK